MSLRSYGVPGADQQHQGQAPGNPRPQETAGGADHESGKPGPQSNARVKPGQLVEAQHVEWDQPCLCYSPLAEPLPGFVGRDYSARGAGDGAGKNPFTEKRK